MEKKRSPIAEANTKPVAERIKQLVRSGKPIGEAVAAGLNESRDKRANPPKNFARRRR